MQVGFVGIQDLVEMFEIRGLQLMCVQVVDVYVVFGCVGDCVVVWWFVYVLVVCVG